MTPAAALTNQIRAATSTIGARLFNTHVGKFWAGRPIQTMTGGEIVTITVIKNGQPRTTKFVAKQGETVVTHARVVNVGIKGQSDLNGWIPVIVTQEMVGTTVAVRVEIEVKTTDRPSPEQLAWIAAVIKNGGRAGIARTAEDAISICKGY